MPAHHVPQNAQWTLTRCLCNCLSVAATQLVLLVITEALSVQRPVN